MSLQSTSTVFRVRHETSASGVLDRQERPGPFIRSVNCPAARLEASRVGDRRVMQGTSASLRAEGPRSGRETAMEQHVVRCYG